MLVINSKEIKKKKRMKFALIRNVRTEQTRSRLHIIRFFELMLLKKRTNDAFIAVRSAI